MMSFIVYKIYKYIRLYSAAGPSPLGRVARREASRVRFYMKDLIRQPTVATFPKGEGRLRRMI